MGTAPKPVDNLTSNQVDLLKLSLIALAQGMSSADVLALADRLHDILRDRRSDDYRAAEPRCFTFRDGASQ